MFRLDPGSYPPNGTWKYVGLGAPSAANPNNLADPKNSNGDQPLQGVVEGLTIVGLQHYGITTAGPREIISLLTNGGFPVVTGT